MEELVDILVTTYNTEELTNLGLSEEEISNYKKIKLYDEISMNPNLEEKEYSEQQIQDDKMDVNAILAQDVEEGTEIFATRLNNTEEPLTLTSCTGAGTISISATP